MALALNLYRLYTQAFGDGVALPFPAVRIPDGNVDREDYEELAISPGVLGEEVLRGDFNFKSKQGGTFILPVKMGLNPNNQWQLPNEPFLSISGSKRLRVTNLGRRGTVKEERSLNDYEITIRGLAINEDENDYPANDMAQIRKIVESTGVVYITSYVTTQIWNINKVSIKDFDMPRFPGNSLRVQPYVIQCLSDMDFDDYARLINGDSGIGLNLNESNAALNPNSTLV